jgi:hypothetical protein
MAAALERASSSPDRLSELDFTPGGEYMICCGYHIQFEINAIYYNDLDRFRLLTRGRFLHRSAVRKKPNVEGIIGACRFADFRREIED